MAKPVMKFEWDTSSLKKVRRDLEITEAKFKIELGASFLEVIRSKIRSRTGALAAGWKVRPMGPVLVYSNRLPYAFASVKGNFIRPTRRKALAFEVGGQRVFSKRARYAPGAYIGRRGSNTSYLDEAVKAFDVIARKSFGDACKPLGKASGTLGTGGGLRSLV